MYAALGIIENSNHSGELMGVHQKLDRTARWLIAKNMPIASIDFPILARMTQTILSSQTMMTGSLLH